MFEVNAEIVRELLDYNPETGEFRWKARDRKYFESDHRWKVWNSKNSSKTAGTPNPRGYRNIKIFYKLYRAHRLAWLHYYGEWPENHIDHINNQTDDNRIENLRDATRSQNLRNSSIQTGTSSQYKGVSWHKQHNKWRAYISINEKPKHLGLFTIEENAARAYDRAAIKHFGIYAKLNFPIEDYL